MSVIRETNNKRIQDVIVGGIPYYPRTITEAVWSLDRKKNLKEILDEIYAGGGGGGELNNVLWANVLNKPSWITDTKPAYTASEVGALPASTPIFSGNYNDLTGAPNLGGLALKDRVSVQDIDALGVPSSDTFLAGDGYWRTGGGGGGGSTVSWGVEINNYAPLTVEMEQKAVALLGHVHPKAEVGLGNVDNTSDINKPLSQATITALGGKAEVVHDHLLEDVTDFPEWVNLVGGNNVTITEQGNDIIISSTGGGGDIGETMDVEAGNHIALNVVNNKLQFSAQAATIVEGDNITIEQLPNGDVQISSTGGGDPVNTMEIEAGDNISLDIVENKLQISSIGGGGPLGPVGWDDIEDKPSIVSIVAGDNITIDSLPGGDIEISSTGGGGGSSDPVGWDDIQNKPTSFTPSTHTHAAADISDLGDLSSKDEIEVSDINSSSLIDLSSITGYNASVVQYLTHDASGTLVWVDSL